RFWQPLATLIARSPSRNFRRWWRACLIISLLFVPIANPSRVFTFMIPDSVQPWVYVSPPAQWQRAAAMNQLLAQIPPAASVTASTYLVPHLSGRRAILRMPRVDYIDDQGAVQTVDYVAADLWQLQRYQVAFSRDRAELATFIALINDWVASGAYGLRQAQDGLILLQKGQPSDPQAVQDWQRFIAASGE
ncbi:MAG TPA: DUF2079 domain-containing protein, partial [Candidatus Obscuribacterales bacterium]